MRRAAIVLGATAAGLAVVLSFHTASAPATLGGSAINNSSTSSASSTTGSSASKTGSGSGSGSKTGSGSASGSTSTSGSSSKTGSGSGSKTGSTSTGTRTATGSAVNYFYGDISVEVVASGHKITDVSIASLDDDGNFRSQSIDQQSIPVLEEEAVQAQSANIQGVSGATYTSQGFVQSLQSALSKLDI